MSVLDLQKFEGEIKAHAQCVSGVQWDHTDASKGEEKSRAAPMPLMHHPSLPYPHPHPPLEPTPFCLVQHPFRTTA